MKISINSRAKSALLGCAAMGFGLAGSAAYAQEDATETVVVTGTRFNTDAAPAKASLDTTEPETIINRNYIENFQQPQADYVNILAIVPSLTGGDPNGVGLSDGGPKNTLRGFPDGNFNARPTAISILPAAWQAASKIRTMRFSLIRNKTLIASTATFCAFRKTMISDG